MLVLTCGSTLHQDWNIAVIQLFYAVVYTALLAVRGAGRYSPDVFMKTASAAK